MTQEEKRLLFIELCARLPYDVQCEIGGLLHGPYTFTGNDVEDLIAGRTFKPYLRPLSSMTEEEKKIMRSCGFEPIRYDTGHTGFANIESCIDEVSFRFMEEFLNSHHFDHRGLIPMGLAIEAPEGMYKF